MREAGVSVTTLDEEFSQKDSQIKTRVTGRLLHGGGGEGTWGKHWVSQEDTEVSTVKVWVPLWSPCVKRLSPRYQCWEIEVLRGGPGERFLRHLVPCPQGR